MRVSHTISMPIMVDDDGRGVNPESGGTRNLEGCLTQIDTAPTGAHASPVIVNASRFVGPPAE